ncbi:MAG TPA: FeoA family protein [Burkholderiaceae bacterium]|nr:FeoA family protein [Burkholderiaceae bacterium]
MARALPDTPERQAGAFAAAADAFSVETITPLDRVPLSTAFVIHEVVYPDDGRGWNQRLEELGFLPGERVLVLTRGRPGGDPLAVRVGHSTFALRCAETACVRVRPWPPARVRS